jgi:hypothetical protein
MAGPFVFVTDLQHMLNEYFSGAPLNDGGVETQGMTIAQLDADPQLEYVIRDGDNQACRVSAFDGLSHEREWSSGVWGADAKITALASGDLNGDSVPEILVGTSEESPGSFVRILRAADGAPLWQGPTTPATYDGVSAIRVGDVDGDGQMEFVFVKDDDGVYVYDGATYAQEWYQAQGAATAVDLGDVDGDLGPDIVLSAGSWLFAYDGSTKAELFRYIPPTVGWISAVCVADIDADGENEIVFARRNLMEWSMLRVIRPSDRSVLWESPWLTANAGLANSLYVADADDDGHNEIAVGCTYSVRLFEYGAAVADTEPPWFPGAEGVQSAVAKPCCTSIDLDWEEALDASSPPVEYNVYRDTVPGFAPGPGSFLGRTPFSSYRDQTVAAGARYYYIVRATDREGNEDANLVEQSAVAVAADAIPPDQGNSLRAVKAGSNVQLSFPGAPATIWRVYRDAAKTQIGSTAVTPDASQSEFSDSGGIARPGNSFYVIRGLSPCTRTPGP